MKTKLQNTIRQSLSISTVATLLILTSAASSSAMDTDSSAWDTRSYADTSGSKLDEMIFTKSGEGAPTAFICADNKLLAAVSVVPLDMSQAIETLNETRRKVPRKVEHTIAGETVEGKKWVYNPMRDMIMQSDRRTVAKIYNAALRGDTVTLHRDKGTEITLNLPTPNTDFKNFGKGCGIGLKKS